MTERGRKNAPTVRTPSQAALKASIRKFDPALDEDSDEFKAALVMFAALYVGTGHGSYRKLSKLTGVAYDQVPKFGGRLRDAGIWSEGQTVAKWDNDEAA